MSNKTPINLWLDVVTLVVMLGLVFTGCLLFFVLPPGTGGRHGGEGLVLLGWGRHDYGTVHFYLACTLVVLLAVHVWLHWAWVCSVVTKLARHQPPERSTRFRVGLATIGAVLIIVVAPLVWATNHVESAATGVETDLARASHFRAASSNRTSTTLPGATTRDAPGARDRDLAETAEGPGTSVPLGPIRSPERVANQRLSLAATQERSVDKKRPRAGVVRRNELHVRDPINGQTTLVEAARAAGMSPTGLRQRLGLLEKGRTRSGGPGLSQTWEL